jgi:hypothetical protein
VFKYWYPWIRRWIRRKWDEWGETEVILALQIMCKVQQNLQCSCDIIRNRCNSSIIKPNVDVGILYVATLALQVLTVPFSSYTDSTRGHGAHLLVNVSALFHIRNLGSPRLRKKMVLAGLQFHFPVARR